MFLNVKPMSCRTASYTKANGRAKISMEKERSCYSTARTSKPQSQGTRQTASDASSIQMATIIRANLETTKQKDTENSVRGTQFMKDNLKTTSLMAKQYKPDKTFASSALSRMAVDKKANLHGEMSLATSHTSDNLKRISSTVRAVYKTDRRPQLAISNQEGWSARSQSPTNNHMRNDAIIFLIAMNLNLRMKSDYKEQPIKSPRHFTPENARKVAAPRNCEAPQLKAFIRAYRKQVELPINFETSIFQSKTPQRCLQHNNVITLYCMNDKKPLCAQCMYQVVAHGKHEVIPLGKANNTLKEELNNALKDINSRLLPSVGQLIGKSQANLEQTDREMGELMQRVNKFWNEIIANANSKRNQQISQYQTVWNRLRYEYRTFGNQLARINQYMNDRLKEISEKNTEQNLLYCHNVVMCLHRMEQIIAPPFCEYQELKAKDLYDRLDEATQTVKNAFNFQTTIVKQEAPPAVIEKEVSQSLKKDKAHWIPKKAENGSTLSNINNQNKISPQKMPSPRTAFIMSKSPTTQRDFVNNSPKKQTTFRFFRKDSSVKQKIGFQKTLKNRKSETNMFFAQR